MPIDISGCMNNAMWKVKNLKYKDLMAILELYNDFTIYPHTGIDMVADEILAEDAYRLGTQKHLTLPSTALTTKASLIEFLGDFTKSYFDLETHPFQFQIPPMSDLSYLAEDPVRPFINDDWFHYKTYPQYLLYGSRSNFQAHKYKRYWDDVDNEYYYDWMDEWDAGYVDHTSLTDARNFTGTSGLVTTYRPLSTGGYVYSHYFTPIIKSLEIPDYDGEGHVYQEWVLYSEHIVNPALLFPKLGKATKLLVVSDVYPPNKESRYYTFAGYGAGKGTKLDNMSDDWSTYTYNQFTNRFYNFYDIPVSETYQYSMNYQPFIYPITDDIEFEWNVDKYAENHYINIFDYTPLQTDGEVWDVRAWVCYDVFGEYVAPE